MNRQPRRFSQSGFSLLEVLITLVIIAIGLMGFASMMLNSMKNNRIAMQRSLATLYAYDIIDCMRANRANKAAYEINFADDPPAGSTIAETDVALWRNELGTLLPAGKGQIDFTGDTAKVEIQWSESLKTGDDATHTWSTESTL